MQIKFGLNKINEERGIVIDHFDFINNIQNIVYYNRFLMWKFFYLKSNDILFKIYQKKFSIDLTKSKNKI